MPQMGLKDKVAIVTGAGSRADGIGNGRAAAILLAREGARVALLDATRTFFVSNGINLDLYASVAGSYGITKTGSGDLYVWNSNYCVKALVVL